MEDVGRLCAHAVGMRTIKEFMNRTQRSQKNRPWLWWQMRCKLHCPWLSYMLDSELIIYTIGGTSF